MGGPGLPTTATFAATDRNAIGFSRALQAQGLDYDSAEAEFVPDMEVALDREAAARFFRLVEALEDLDDVRYVFTNADVPDEVMAALE